MLGIPFTAVGNAVFSSKYLFMPSGKCEALSWQKSSLTGFSQAGSGWVSLLPCDLIFLLELERKWEGWVSEHPILTR